MVLSNMNKLNIMPAVRTLFSVLGLSLIALNSPAQTLPSREPQIVVARVEKMPRVPQPLHIMDWKKAAREYYTVLFNPDLKGVGLPAVNLAADRKHFGFDSYLKPPTPQGSAR